MNTFSSSTAMTLSMARYASSEPTQQAQARATLRALRAEQRQATTTAWRPFAWLSSHVTVRTSSVATSA